MPANEKEYNGNLFDQLSILERIEAVTKDEAALKQIAVERKQIERKLYQKPPLTEYAGEHGTPFSHSDMT